MYGDLRCGEGHKIHTRTHCMSQRPNKLHAAQQPNVYAHRRQERVSKQPSKYDAAAAPAPSHQPCIYIPLATSRPAHLIHTYSYSIHVAGGILLLIRLDPAQPLFGRQLGESVPCAHKRCRVGMHNSSRPVCQIFVLFCLYFGSSLSSFFVHFISFRLRFGLGLGPVFCLLIACAC